MKTGLLPWLLAICSGVLLAADAPRLAPEAEQPTVITAVKEKIVRGETETVITYDQAVTVTGTGLRILCDHLEVVLIRVGDKSATVSDRDQFKSLVATGHVQITQGDREASCGRAEILPGEDKIVLTEKPVVIYHDDAKGPAINAGTRITIHRGKREIEVDNPETTLAPIKSFGINPSDLTPAKPGTKQP